MSHFCTPNPGPSPGTKPCTFKGFVRPTVPAPNLMLMSLGHPPFPLMGNASRASFHSKELVATWFTRQFCLFSSSFLVWQTPPCPRAHPPGTPSPEKQPQLGLGAVLGVQPVSHPKLALHLWAAYSSRRSLLSCLVLLGDSERSSLFMGQDPNRSSVSLLITSCPRGPLPGAAVQSQPQGSLQGFLLIFFFHNSIFFYIFQPRKMFSCCARRAGCYQATCFGLLCIGCFWQKSGLEEEAARGNSPGSGGGH